MKLTSMKMTAKEAQSEYGVQAAAPASVDPNLPEYPYELRITLDTEMLDKLRLDPTGLKIGQQVQITARGEVVGVDMSKRQSGEERESVGIQITDLAVDAESEGDFEEGFDEG